MYLFIYVTGVAGGSIFPTVGRVTVIRSLKSSPPAKQTEKIFPLSFLSLFAGVPFELFCPLALSHIAPTVFVLSETVFLFI